MKRFCADNYNRIVWAIWAMFIFLLWLQYIHLSSIVEASLFLIVLIPAICISHILANVWLPKALRTKRIIFFVFQFFAATFFNAFLLAGCYQCIKLAVAKGYIPESAILIDNNSFMMEFIFKIPTTLIINFGFCGLRFFYENIKLQRVNLETQVQMLQLQINPHFMFNVLNHIHILMQTNVGLASNLLLQYSDMLRFQLYKGKCDSVRLKEEVQFLKNFVEIERLRWGNKIKINYNCDIANKNIKIPPLLLFPFIENVFKYASRTIEKQGFVKIELKQKNTGICLEIVNSKSSVSIQKKSEASGIGLSNTQKRLNLLFGENHHLTIRDEESIYYLKLDICQI